MTNSSSATEKPAAAASTSSGASSTPLKTMTNAMLKGADVTVSAPTALNQKIVEAVQFSNSETAAYAASQIAVAPNMMITQASGLVAQSAANYFDGISKIAMASQAVLLQEMTKNIVKKDLAAAAEDALGALVTDLLVGAAATVAAAAGALEADATGFAIDKIDQSIAKYKDLLDGQKGGP